jgi:hypothetical protein
MRKSILIKYHWAKFFLQWLNLYLNPIIGAINADIWARKKGVHIPIITSLRCLQWNNWQLYKKHHHYMLKHGNVLILIPGEGFAEGVKPYLK